MPGQVVQHWPHILLCGLVGIFGFVDAGAFTLLPVEHMNHQWWRLLTGHLVHTNVPHLLMNLLGFTLICLAFPNTLSWKERILVLLFLMLSIGSCITLFDQFEYFGLSGVVHGYTVYLLLRFWQANKTLYSALLILISLKVISENLGLLDTSHTADLIKAPVATSSHLYGLFSGLFTAFSRKIAKKEA